MTRNTKRSNLAIAAIALLAASVPCFAQAQSVEVSGEASNGVAITVPELVASSRPQFTAVRPRPGIFNLELKSATGVALSEKPHSFSPASFMVRMGEVSGSDFLGQQPTIYEMGLGNSKKQFGADDDYGGVDQRKHVTSVPSLGQKLPDSKQSCAR